MNNYAHYDEPGQLSDGFRDIALHGVLTAGQWYFPELHVYPSFHFHIKNQI